MNALVQTLYFLSTTLLVPVIVLLLLLVVHCLLDVGGFLREWRERQRVSCKWKESQRRLAADPALTSPFPSSPDAMPGLVRLFASRTMSDAYHRGLMEKHANDIEIESAGRLARLNLIIRVGPMLGLMGTLIPLGPALIRLSDGNLSGMADDLVVAFSTTVLGLLVGGFAYVQWLVRRQWYAQDLADIEFLCRCVDAGADALFRTRTQADSDVVAHDER